jgi:hypothetical protein
VERRTTDGLAHLQVSEGLPRHSILGVPRTGLAGWSILSEVLAQARRSRSLVLMPDPLISGQGKLDTDWLTVDRMRKQ